MSNNVTIKVDSKVLYSLIAVVAVAGIFGIGWWLGNQIGGEGEQAAAPAANPAAPVQPAAGDAGSSIDINSGGIQSSDPNIQISTPAPQAKPAQPVGLEEQPTGEGEPRLWVDDVADTNFVWDFGSIPPDQAVERDFVVRNLGSGTLVIEDVSASCGCTAAIVADSSLEAGEETTVRVSYDPRHNQEFGKFVQKQVRIKSNDPLVPLAEFTIQADVEAE